MISKFAIQSGLGVAVVGGGIGIAVWKLKKTPIVPDSTTGDSNNNEIDSQPSDKSSDEPDISDGYLVKVPADTNVNNQPSEELTNTIGEKNKNYFCQWGSDNDKKYDKDCVIKQIQFDTNKKVVFLSKIMEKFNSTSDANSQEIATIKPENLKNEKNWFFLRIKGYKFDPEATSESKAPNIDIVSSSAGDKKYTIVTPKFKLENNKIKQGKTRTFLVKHTKDKTNATIKDFQCKWNNAGAKSQECYIYKFGTQPTLSKDNKSINEISLENTVKLEVAIEDNNYYIISFKSQEQVISSWTTIPLTIIIVEKKDQPNTIGREFTVINPMIGKVRDSKVENLILLN